MPYEYIGKEVEIRSTEKTVEVFYQSHRIASHIKTSYSPEPIYVPEHMPEKHRKFMMYNGEHFEDWARSVGKSTLVVTRHFLTMHRVEQQGYKPCASFMRLADRYSTERVENACERALIYTPNPSLKIISTILKNGQDRVESHIPDTSPNQSRGITRGASYFKGGDRS